MADAKRLFWTSVNFMTLFIMVLVMVQIGVFRDGQTAHPVTIYLTANLILMASTLVEFEEESDPGFLLRALLWLPIYFVMFGLSKLRDRQIEAE